MADTVAAVDLGATSGRVMLGHVGPHDLRLEAVARFSNTPVATRDGLHWNILELYRNVVEGLVSARREAPSLASVGIDSWAVDYGLMRGGRMLGTPYHYRDARNAAGVEAVHAVVPPESLYAVNGLQHLPFNTVFQLAADRAAGTLELADRILLVPDLLAYWLTGVEGAESTNASTTGLQDARTGRWSSTLLEQLHLPPSILPALVRPGDEIGRITADVATSLEGLPVTAVGSHDTASAVVAVPATGHDFAYVSCGTWSLVGVETEAPVLSEKGRLAGFTNEGGVDGRTRYLHNVMGLWLLTESVKLWASRDSSVTLGDLLAAAAELPPERVSLFDVDDPRFLAPGDMPARIGDWLREHDRPAPRSKEETVRSILESLAVAYASAIERLADLTGVRVNTVHLVGGGSQNVLLCQLTADRTGLPVFAGPVEATALGNVLVQARAAGLVSGSLESLRSLVRETHEPIRYVPRAVPLGSPRAS